MQMSTTNKEYQAAIKWAEKRAATKLALKTIKEYWGRYNCLNDSEILPGSASNPRTRQYNRAAFRFCIAHEILSAAHNQDYALVYKLWADKIEIDAQAKKNKEQYEAGLWDGKKHYRNSKKASLDPLPKDWRVSLCNLMINHVHNVAVRILACTGCRPEEVKTGIRVYRNENGINFDIVGAKFIANGVRGQESRTLTIPNDHPIGSTISDGYYQANTPESLTKAISRKAKKLGFKGVSAYSFRHQMASDLKFSGYEDLEIACALGHICTEAQEGYGNTGAGGSVKLIVKSSATPRVSNKNSKKAVKPKKT